MNVKVPFFSVFYEKSNLAPFVNAQILQFVTRATPLFTRNRS